MSDTVDALLAEQIAYYRALAPDYFNCAFSDPAARAAGSELQAALDAFAPTGDVLELACGPGSWTPQLLRHTASVTALDASPEMLAIARQRAPEASFIEADIFCWRPDRRYGVVFFGFWLSHVPPQRFESFWSLVADCLAPKGRVFFVDDGFRTADERPNGAVIRRRCSDGTEHRLVKTPHDAVSLQALLDELGWRIEVRETSSIFYWGSGVRGA